MNAHNGIDMKEVKKEVCSNINDYIERRAISMSKKCSDKEHAYKLVKGILREYYFGDIRNNSPKPQ